MTYSFLHHHRDEAGDITGLKQTLSISLTSQDVHDQLHVGAELLDVVQVGHRHNWHILVAVHLGDEVHVTGQILPEEQRPGRGG